MVSVASGPFTVMVLARTFMLRTIPLNGYQRCGSIVVGTENVIGSLTWATVPGLKRQRRTALSAALSRIACPVLGAISALVTNPVRRSMCITAMP